ncbi:MAG TPA: hypothetical protein VG649_13880 [Candidatus Angelobacter sp.]|jgi:hypothetical protein|nr:hypothetical protein [Candidatus Angelobacter sp.]
MSKNGDDKSQLYTRIPPDIFQRVKAAAELIGLDKDQFITECLDEATKPLKDVQERMKRERDARQKDSKTSNASSDPKIKEK